MQPFELGEVFQVYLTANGGAGGSPGCDSNCGPGAGESTAGISIFQLTEADGTTPVPFFAIVTPEPATWGFLLFGLAACALFYVRTRKTGLGPLSAPNLKL